jgi:hypothetical protein
MSFKIQQPATGLYWTVDTENNVCLGSESSLYEKDDSGHIRNMNTGLYIRHNYWVLKESELDGPEYDFEWTIEDSGRISTKFDGGYYVAPDGNTLKIIKDGFIPTWKVIPEVDVPVEEDVPVSRASALIEEALNAKAANPGCGCECGCGPDCQGCACECGCPKAPAAPVEVPEEAPAAPVEVPEEAPSA